MKITVEAGGVDGQDFVANPVRGVLIPTGHQIEEGSSYEESGQIKIEQIRDVRRDDIKSVLEWASNPEVRKHLVPAPRVPNSWNNRRQVQEAVDRYAEYLNNKGEPEKITPSLAVDASDNPLAIAVIRWRGDPYVPAHERIASLEGLIVDPRRQGKLVGTTFVSTLIELMFDGYKGYSGSRGAKEIRAWVMNDKQASPWQQNFDFFRRLGFQVVPTDKHWKEYVETRGMEDQLAEEERGRDALWLQLLPGWYEKAKAEKPEIIKPCQSLNPNLLKSKTI